MNDEAYRDRFQLAIVALWQIHKPDGAPLPIETQRAYLMALSDIPIESIESAAMKAAQTLKWFPKPAELRELAAPSKPVRLSAVEAWQLVLTHAVGHRIRRGPIDFGDLTNAAVRAVGGIDHLASGSTAEHESFTRPRFIEAYELLTSRPLHELSGRPLIGDGGEGKPVQLIGPSARPRIKQEPPSSIASGILIKRA